MDHMFILAAGRWAKREHAMLKAFHHAAREPFRELKGFQKRIFDFGVLLSHRFVMFVPNYHQVHIVAHPNHPCLTFGQVGRLWIWPHKDQDNNEDARPARSIRIAV